jgi:two-component system KDP operon response regulator KdpE
MESAGRAFSAPPHFLVVEDEHLTRHVLELLLARSGFTSDCASSGLEAIRRLGEGAYDAMLLDLKLPDIDGGHLIRVARSSSEMLILVMAEQASADEKINALDLGADDVITKPFHPGELLARIRAIQRRRRERKVPPTASWMQSAPSGNVIELDHFDCTPRERQVLRVLQNKANDIVSIGEIALEIWGKETYYRRNQVRTLLGTLQRSLARQDIPVTIKSERGNGYRLSMEVALDRVGERAAARAK